MNERLNSGSLATRPAVRYRAGPMGSLDGKRFCISWSGGKDSCLAAHRAVLEGGIPVALLTMCREDGERSRSHGLSPAVLRAQAISMGLPIWLRSASWSDYEETFVTSLRDLRGLGIEACVFGDIDLADHRKWVEGVCARAGIEAILPLWGADRRGLLDELLGAGFAARIVVTREGRLPPTFLGRTLDPSLIDELIARDVDVAGEGGEFHTVVTGGPLFAWPIELREIARAHHSGCWFLEVEPG